jgi:hypothetical protein
MRHLGLVRQLCSSPFIRAALLIWMAVRVCKNDLNSRLRLLATKHKLTFESPFHVTQKDLLLFSFFYFFFQSLLIECLNTIGGITDRSTVFWSETLPKMLETKYGLVDFKSSDFGRIDDLQSRFSLPLVQLLLGEVMGCVWVRIGSVLRPIEEIAPSSDLSHITKVVCIAPIQTTDISG